MGSFFKKALLARNKKRKTKGIVFHKDVTVHEFPLAQVETTELWYGRQEYKRFEAENIITIMKMMGHPKARGALVCPERESIRGLDLQHPELRKRSDMTRKVAYAAVLKEQELQNMTSFQDPQAIAKAYSRACEDSKEVALGKGRHDEKLSRQRIMPMC
jgi:hypothetical protein